ncbi:hypothetical protein [Bdellovibrio sp. HCB2-146]|uniref:hypothetical protein n=1 Tax=Bdellovibrio sp. HCB2-146 TaxID=3394362 RepID=UPI0039BC2E6E
MKHFLMAVLLVASSAASAAVDVDLREVKDIHCSELMNLDEVFSLYGINSSSPRVLRTNNSAMEVKSITKNSIRFENYADGETYTLTLQRQVSTYKGRKILAEYSYEKGNPTTLACVVTY